jgi:hypothetical protein
MLDTDIVDRLWAQIEADVYITRDQFVRGLADWNIEPIEVGSVLAWVTLSRGPEFHYTSFDAGMPLSFARMHGWLAPILAEYGYVTTRTLKDEPRQHPVNRRRGFKATGEDEFCTFYRLDVAKCH